MDLKVLAVPDCPNVVMLEERLAQVLQGRPRRDRQPSGDR